MGKRKQSYSHPYKKKGTHGREERPVKAKKHLGQHFLKDEEIAQKISTTLSMSGYKDVLEIGPGTGMLTKYLLMQDINLIAMDLDADSIVYLNHTFPLEHPDVMDRNGSFEVVEADVLQVDFKTIFGDKPFAIIGNFPYNISTQIVFKLLEYRQQIPEFSGMFQMEVAKRICEKEGSKAYGILSVFVQAFYEAEYLFTVHPEVFDPPPKVQSGVLKLTRKPSIVLDCDEALFFKVVKTSFNQRRKTIRNSLKIFNLSQNLKEDAIFDQRPEQLGVNDFISLTRKIANDTI